MHGVSAAADAAAVLLGDGCQVAIRMVPIWPYQYSMGHQQINHRAVWRHDLIGVSDYCHGDEHVQVNKKETEGARCDAINVNLGRGSSSHVVATIEHRLL